ncbi:Efflux transporter outer membrane subunit [Sulfidibacter corallicola]|uniref:Efflux transporter outer membrane subunit n=1 Tax=Sulfidibacter corallicola TaxID=2818388 RepID=A0A8A4THI6_SULCO|nr:efflux transporter outer membrane subunit [Sulfidibacter corallicola]QTD48664.1 efflux transporter outer membrane subunit [Sulfidibacter corallicola]
MKKSIAVAASICFMISACVVGPDYKKPTLEVEGWIHAANEEPVDLAWWTLFEDPILNGLVEEVASSNLDIQMAQSRLREARALQGIAKASRYPVISGNGGFTDQQQSLNGPGAAPALIESGQADRRSSLYEAGFDVAWELDLFGGKRRAREAAAARVGVAVAGKRDVAITMIGELARNYIELRGNQKRLRLLSKHVETQEETLRLIRQKVKFGLAREVDETRAKAQLEHTRAQLPNLEAAISSASYRIDILTGRQPGALYQTLATSIPLPAPPEVVPMGLKSDLLRRRPDIQQAERELAESTANIGVKVAELYPSFSLTGSAGYQAVNSLGDLFKGASGLWLLRPSIDMPIFAGGRLRADVEAAEARERHAALSYERTVLNALRETESALVSYAKEQETRIAYMESVQASSRSVELTSRLYRQGLIDFFEVLSAQQSLLTVQDQLAQSETRALSHLIALYKSLGGGWEVIEESMHINQNKEIKDEES